MSRFSWFQWLLAGVLCLGLTLPLSIAGVFFGFERGSWVGVPMAFAAWISLCFGLFAMIIGIVYLFGDRLGGDDALEKPHQGDRGEGKTEASSCEPM